MQDTIEKPRMYPNGYNTLKKRKLLKALETEPNLRQAGIKAGYSRVSPNIYKKAIKSYLKKNIHSDPEAIKARFEDIADRAALKEDMTNELRAVESLARINAQFTDKSIIDNKTPAQIVISYGNTRPSIPQAETSQKSDNLNG